MIHTVKPYTFLRFADTESLNQGTVAKNSHSSRRACETHWPESYSLQYTILCRIFCAADACLTTSDWKFSQKSSIHNSLYSAETMVLKVHQYKHHRESDKHRWCTF